MKKNNQRSKSFTAKNSGTSSATNSNTRPKPNKRNSAPISPQKLRTETLSTPTSEVVVEKEKISTVRRKRGQDKKEGIPEEVDKVIDLSRTEDAERMMLQLVNMLGIRNLPVHNQTSFLEDENDDNEMSVDRRKFATAVIRPEVSKIKDFNSAKPTPVYASKTLIDGFSESKRHTISAQQNHVKLPNIKDHGRQLFQVLYSRPTDFQKLQKSQPRPLSLSRITSRGMDFASERYRLGCASRANNYDFMYSRNGTRQSYPSPGTRSNLSRGTVVYRSILSRGKPKTERLSRVTFVDEHHDLIRNDGRGERSPTLQVF